MRVVLVGRFAQSKGQHLAVEAIAIARKAGVDIELALIGGGNHKPVRKLAQRLGVEDLVNFTDQPTMSDATGPPPMSASSAANARRSASSPWRR